MQKQQHFFLEEEEWKKKEEEEGRRHHHHPLFDSGGGCASITTASKYLSAFALFTLVLSPDSIYAARRRRRMDGLITSHPYLGYKTRINRGERRGGRDMKLDTP